ncbi:bifunctional adenosylcobinamide kinase/adenosylcobinamide-phosphate guanylyltransferase [uncultured Shimia sp.]|uniref:bifunctional adenosylcobinamide kinase/adenosylcobinamide-phosphate guanylyltransferase n=1 Tax=uncultured Shimia sp. TaxID=573152 RepID=UPI00261BDBDE|nr:bifunctional adenosylcobinamide kinase/adenosylcobinamide-phosphate guanylyltransferase [uncultured Shimia sp.]
MILKTTFILGGAASGKSTYAEHLVVATGKPRVYLATSQAYDAEMEDKISRHQTSRGPDWETVECPFELAKALAKIRADQVALVDCATMWLSNHLLKDHDLEAESGLLLRAIVACKGQVVIVSNEVGMGVVPDNALARKFRNVQGKLNQQISEISETAILVVAGLPMALKGELP